MEQSNLARIFKALGNEQRLALFEMVYRMSRQPGSGGAEGLSPADAARARRRKAGAPEPCCRVRKAFTAACGCMGLARSTVSHHFKELQNAGLITCTREGQSFLCEVNPDAVEAVRAFLKE
jgi:ArsR family transcriptional regulator